MKIILFSFKWSLYRHEYRNPIKSDFYELVSSPDRNGLEQLLQSLGQVSNVFYAQK